ncbi:MAG: hypothetical protein AAGA85_14340 [Bacteroidota bacterium]
MVRQNNKLSLLAGLRKWHKPLAAFFIVNLLGSVVYPTVSYALTAGPTAPEATSFEPIDTTDMVNLATGDLAYNIPLLEVPGSSGSYPVALSYHAGIMPGEEASWVGLGWTLNPGAITRSVNGFADDHNDVQNTTRFFWEGGETQVVNIGVSATGFGVESVGGGLSIGHDTYQGMGVGGFLSVGFQTTGGVGVSFGSGVDPWGNPYASAGLSAGQNLGGPLAFSSGIGISTNLGSVSASASSGISVNYGANRPPSLKNGQVQPRLRAGNASLVGSSISSSGSGIGFSQSVGGFSQEVGNSRASRISTSGWSLPLPLPFLNLSYRYSRYWIDETDDVSTNGILYNPTAKLNAADLDQKDFDTYHLHSRTSLVEGIDMSRVKGGTFPNYDAYRLDAQGLGGNFAPSLLQSALIKKNIFTTDNDDNKHYTTIEYPLSGIQKPMGYRFLNDFSNRYEYDAPDMPAGDSFEDAFSYDFEDGVELAGSEDDIGLINGRLLAGRHIEHWTNEQILAEPTFIDNYATGFDRSAQSPDQLGAFVVTNESGVKYHFTQPAYAFDEYSYSENRDIKDKLTFNELHQPEKYAYTWYLTGMTGPDYVDRAPVGQMGPEDWGYWVAFDYGKWTDQYFWRNPPKAQDQDLDQKFLQFKEGTKELYYLDAIRTNTHTAFFVKEIRDDGKSAVKVLRDIRINRKGAMRTVKIHEEQKEGGFFPKPDLEFELTRVTETDNVLNLSKFDFIYDSKPTSTLGLSKVLLFDNEKLAEVDIDKSSGVGYELSTDFPDIKEFNFQEDQHLQQNVLDINDVDLAHIEQRALRVIDLGSDNSLAPGTPNSFSSELVQDGVTITDNDLGGKRTLRSLTFRGKGGAGGFIPPMRFDYDLDEPWETGAIFEGQLTIDNGELQEDDIIETKAGFYLVGRKAIDGTYAVTNIGGPNVVQDRVGVQLNIEWRRTKNPAYNEQLYDIWNMYKPDYDDNNNRDVDRYPSQTSSKHADVWSLRKITTSLGGTIDIGYETDEYHESVLYNNQSWIISEFLNQDEQAGTIEVHFRNGEGFLKEFLEEDDFLRLHCLYTDRYSNGGNGQNVDAVLTYGATVEEVHDTYIVARSPNMVNFFFGFDDGTNGDDITPTLRRNLIGGNAEFDNDFTYGGGIKVTSLTVSDALSGVSTTTHYDYNDPSTGLTSGVTSYEPVGFGNFITYGRSLDSPEIIALRNFFSNEFSVLLENGREAPPPGVMYEFVTTSTTVTQADGQTTRIPSRSVYEFEVFQRHMLELSNRSATAGAGLQETNIPGVGEIKNNIISSNNVTIKDFTSQIGNLKRITLYDEQDRKITETINHFLHDEQENPRDRATYERAIEEDYRGQGILEETFVNARFAQDEIFDQSHQLIGVVSKRERFPSIAIGQTNINYRSGTSTTSRNLAFDFYSGAPTLTYQTDAYGNQYVTEQVPAYRLSLRRGADAYPEMGPALSGGKNMLTQQGASFNYKMATAYDPYFDDYRGKIYGMLSGTLQTWENGEYSPMVYHAGVVRADEQAGIYRQKGRYSFIGPPGQTNRDGSLVLSNGHAELMQSIALDQNQPELSYGWRQDSEVTRYDVFSHALEATDVNGNFVATKMDWIHEHVLSTVANARYDEYAYSGAEDGFTFNPSIREYIPAGEGPGPIYFGGDIFQPEGQRLRRSASVPTHTGEWSVEIFNNGRAFEFNGEVLTGQTYKIQVWSTTDEDVIFRKDVDDIQDTTIPFKVIGQVDGWFLLEATTTIDEEAAGQLIDADFWVQGKTAGVQKFFDDFRVFPVNATMTSYVYNEHGELSDILDSDNLFTHYEYDEMGRLKSTHRETFQYGVVRTSEITINYANQN